MSGHRPLPAFPGHRHEHHRISSSCSNPGRTGTSEQQAGNNGPSVRRNRRRCRLDIACCCGSSRGRKWRFFVLAAKTTLSGTLRPTMVGLIRPLAARLLRFRRNGEVSAELLGLMVVFAFASAAAIDALGLHPLFGAFLAGLCFQRDLSRREAIRGRFDLLISVLLLPMFFALTGMRTRLDLLSTPATWLWTAIILAAATVGKMGGASLAGRWTGQSWRDSLALGVLLNTRDSWT